MKQIQLVVRAGRELGDTIFQVWRPNHSATLPSRVGGHQQTFVVPLRLFMHNLYIVFLF